MTCILCHTEKADRNFSKDSPICQSCIHSLEDNPDVEYSPPEHVTRLEGFIKLLIATRDQAIEDAALAEWESTFIDDPQWKLVWSLLKVEEFTG